MDTTTHLRYIFITGGIYSSLGKGIAAAALGAILRSFGFWVKIRKIDPYLNVDSGTMNPAEHGEVFVTEDGAETDLDLGHYERFTGVFGCAADAITTGKIYSRVIAAERKGDYLGQTVQVIPHITDEIKRALVADVDSDVDFLICEIGGTVGDIEGLPFLEAIRQFVRLDRRRSLFIHVVPLPWVAASGELKTKPTTRSVKDMRSMCTQPDIVLCRCDREIDVATRNKMSMFCDVPPERIIAAIDLMSIYEAPIAYSAAGLDREVLRYFNLPWAEGPNLAGWARLVSEIRNASLCVKIAVVSKYKAPDAHKSLFEALTHASAAVGARAESFILDATEYSPEECALALCAGMVDAVIVPGGYGVRGTESMIAAIRWARVSNVPFLGICFGMQLAAIEAARAAGVLLATSTEFCADTISPVVSLLNEQGAVTDLGGTARRGAHPVSLVAGGYAREIYGREDITERFRHRYEVNARRYKAALAGGGLIVTGVTHVAGITDLPAVMENPSHPWFLATQFHPELKSRPMDPHPLFVSLITAAVKK